MRYFFFLFFFTNFISNLFSQQDKDTIYKLEEVMVKSQRISVSFAKLSSTITILSNKEILDMGTMSTEEVLQKVAGVDIRRRGVSGMQSDLYIRGGNFNQTLLLIDGISMNNSQTGHHLMNAIIATENIAQIEVFKGVASRIFGENAMNGAINIITKEPTENSTSINTKYASFDTYGIELATQRLNDDKGYYFHFNRLQSEGYRYNTDFNNLNSLLKVRWKENKLFASYSERSFGANGFYASPLYKDQYEETQTSLVAFSKKIKYKNRAIQTKLYWKRNQDMYLFIRKNPDYYRNMHITNNIGFTANTVYKNTGIGIDVNQGFLSSNNLMDHNRFKTTAFVEHRLCFLEDKLDVKYGVAATFDSDFGIHLYPGIDFGYRFSNRIKLYANSGYTYRSPTYTNLYYHSYTEKGNEFLEPEKAFNLEMGINVNFDRNNKVNAALYRRKVSDFIDYVKQNEVDLWQAENVGAITTNGFETDYSLIYKLNGFKQRFNLGYAFINQELGKSDYVYSRYSLNAYKHQFNVRLTNQLFPFLKQSILYSYNERFNEEGYNLLDISLMSNIKKWELGIRLNNILNVEYYETNLVPMPKANFTINIKYKI